VAIERAPPILTNATFASSPIDSLLDDTVHEFGFLLSGLGVVEFESSFLDEQTDALPVPPIFEMAFSILQT
jgi:hypothetical protein